VKNAALYAKSIAAGIVALLASAILWILALSVRAHMIASGMRGSYFIVYHFAPILRSPILLAAATGIFISAFTLQFRRLSRQTK
jgi:hypothetical protein